MKNSGPSHSYANELIRFLHSLRIEALPSTVKETARWALLDTLGCALFGSRQPWSRILLAEQNSETRGGECTVIGVRASLPASAAALCNGTAAHGFELDDHLTAPIVHPGAIVTSASLAAAEAAGSSGSQLLLAVIAGYEVMNRLGLAVGLEPAHRGFHKTVLVGPVAAAVAAAIAMKLPLEQVEAAASLACSAASGIKSFATGGGGGMLKRLHAGRAAEAGVLMARLASRNFSAPKDAIGGKHGFLEVFGGHDTDASRLTAALGETWAKENLYVKAFPCCGWIQSAIQELLTLRGPTPLRAAEVASVRIGVSKYAAKNNGAGDPVDTMAAQYSIPYCAALAVAGNPADPSMYLEDKLQDEELQALSRKVSVYDDETMERAYPVHYGAQVELVLSSGEKRIGTLMDPHGTPADPCSPVEHLAKFKLLSSGVVDAVSQEAVLKMVQDIENLDVVRNLGRALRECRDQE